MSLQAIGHIFMATQRENGRHRTFVDLSSPDFTASCHFPRAQESPSESRIRSELPLESAQELRSNINFALVVAFVSSAYPATDSFRAISLTVLGSSKRAGILGERYVPLVEKHGKNLPKLEEKQYLQPFRVSKDSSKISAYMYIIFLSASESHLAFNLLAPAAIAHFFIC